MRSVVLRGPRTLQVEEHSPCDLPAGHVRVAVVAAGICGSDVHGYLGDNARRPPGTVMGHEVGGVVDEVAQGVDPGLLGAIVAVNPLVACGSCGACENGRDNLCPSKVLIGCVPAWPGGFADSLVVPVKSAVVWAGPAPGAWAAFVEPLAVGLHAVDGRELAGRSVVVVGGGAIGFSTARSAEMLGAGSVVVVEPGADRQDLLRRLGLRVVSPDALVPAAADLVVDCVGTSQSAGLALSTARVAGEVIVVGFGREVIEVPLTPLVHGERIVRGSAQYTSAAFARAAAWLGSGALDISEVFGPPVALEDLPETFRRLGDGGALTGLRTAVRP